MKEIKARFARKVLCGAIFSALFFAIAIQLLTVGVNWNHYTLVTITSCALFVYGFICSCILSMYISENAELLPFFIRKKSKNRILSEIYKRGRTSDHKYMYELRKHLDTGYLAVFRCPIDEIESEGSWECYWEEIKELKPARSK